VEVRQKAAEVVLAVASGAYQTSLLTYFIHRDLFPSVMKVYIKLNLERLFPMFNITDRNPMRGLVYSRFG
jgi:hypothetical protein